MLEAGFSVGMARTAAYEFARSAGYTAYGVDEAINQAGHTVIMDHWQRRYNATVPWPDATLFGQQPWAIIAVPIGGVICEKHADLMLQFDEPSDTISQIREVGPDLRCRLPVLWDFPQIDD